MERRKGGKKQKKEEEFEDFSWIGRLVWEQHFGFDPPSTIYIHTYISKPR
jgi:hypothetical protein